MAMLTEREQSYYAELFQTCDSDGSGKFTWPQVADLFRSSGLSADAISEVTDLCGAKRLGHFGRSQFYVALRLIAAAQCGLPLSHDSINSGKDIPLPKFNRTAPREQGAQFQAPVIPAENVPPVLDRQQSQQGQLPPPPTSAKKSHGRNLSGQFRGHAGDAPTIQPIPAQSVNKEGLLQETVSPPFSPGQAPPPGQVPPTQAPPTLPTIPSPQSPPTSPQTAPVAPRFTSPPAAGAATAPPAAAVGQPPQQPANFQPPGQTQPAAGGQAVSTVTKPVAEHGGAATMTDLKMAALRGTEEWARFESDDEKHGLLGSGKKEGWDNLKLPDFDSSSYSSDTESVEDVWSINDEQREYYVKQFQNIEPDINGHISGNVAKEFFEKSKLSNHELSKIWNLADLNKDGALSLEEFCIAMHLVVLRRNEIDIPDRLPFSLMPYNAFTNEDQEPFAADLPQGSTLKRQSPTSAGSSLPEGQWEGGVPGQPTSAGVSPPLVSSSEVSSPSVTPANFDFQKPEPMDNNEAHIVHPKARRLSPETMNEIAEARPERGRAFSDPVSSVGDGSLHDSDSYHTPLTKQRSNTTANAIDSNNVDAATAAALQGRPRPHAKNPPAVPGALPGHILPPVPSSSHPAGVEGAGHPGEGGEPPVPPPRPGGPHGRSMSVDYKAPPAVPPRVSPKDAPGTKLGQFKHFEAIQSQEVLNIVPGSSATTTTPGIETDKFRRTQSLDSRQTGGGPEDLDAAAAERKKSAVAWDLLGDDFVDGSAERQAEFALAAQRQACRDKKELQMAIRTHKERNSTLGRLNSELNQELQEVMEQRIALEIQLEHLRPFSS